MQRSVLAVLLVLTLVVAGCINGKDSPTGDAPLLEEPVTWNDEVRKLHEQIHAALDEGSTLMLEAAPVSDMMGDTLGSDETFEVRLEKSSLITQETWAEIDGEPVEMPFFEVYEGYVVDRPDWPVRLTLTEQWARGYIVGMEFDLASNELAPLPYLIRINLDRNLPHGAYSDGGAESTRSNAVPTRFDHPAWPEQDCLELVPSHLTPVLDRPAELETITAKIILDGDAQFKAALGDDAFPMMVAMLQESDAIYEVEVGIRFNVTGLHMHTNESYFPDPGDQNPFNALSSYWNDRLDFERDIVHLYTGFDSSYAMANCIGGAGIPELGYTFTPLNWERDTWTFHTTAVAHELGHIFSAHHHHGNHVETGGQLATLMIQGYTPGFRPAFSSLSESTIRGWAEHYLADGALFTTPPGMVDEAVDRLEALYGQSWDELEAMHSTDHAHAHSHDGHVHAN